MLRKTVLKSLAVVAALGTVSALAVAAGGHRHFRSHGAGFGDDFGGGRHGMMRLAGKDADKDGAVTLDEFMKDRADRFAKLDKNADGSLDADEVTADMRGRGDHRMRMMMAKLDADGDGKVTKDEFSALRGHRGGGRHGWGRHHGYDHGWHRGGRRERDGDQAEQLDDDDATPDDTVMPGGDKAAAGGEAKPDAAVTATAEPAREPGRHGWRGAWRERQFSRMDANGDGVVDKADMEARAGEMIAYAKKKMMHVLDKDRDGKISKEEYGARPRQKFADIDLDSDGKITAADLPPRMAERWQRRSGEGDKR